MLTQFLISYSFFTSDQKIDLIKDDPSSNDKGNKQPYVYTIKNDHISTFSKHIDQVLFKTPFETTFLAKSTPEKHIKPFVEMSEPYLPNDPMFPEQYHILNTGQHYGIPGEDMNVTAAWDMHYTGDGVRLMIVDHNILPDHVEYRERFNKTLSFRLTNDCLTNFNESCTDTSPAEDADEKLHGTACASLAAGSHNSHCGSGIAPRVSLSAISIPDLNFMGPIYADILTRSMNDVDIKSNSWGEACVPDPQNMLAWCPQGRSQPKLTPVFDVVENVSRNGRGIIVVVAAGNEGMHGDDTAFSFMQRERYSISVGASTNRGMRTFYSTRGVAILVNAPSGAFHFPILDDMFGVPSAAGPGLEQCMNNMTGTSASCPMVSGSVALMLEANPDLTWRDVQFILAITATQNDPFSPTWVQNHAGFYFSPYYGFGRINVGRAVEYAKTFKTLPPESSAYIPIEDMTLQGCRSGPFVFKIKTNSSIKFIETVEVYFSFTADIYGLMSIILTSPLGTKSVLKIPSINGPFEAKKVKQIVSRQFFGEKAEGTWTLELINQGCLPVTVFSEARLLIHGMNKRPSHTSLQDPGSDSQKELTPLDPSKLFISAPKTVRCGKKFPVTIRAASDLKKFTWALGIKSKRHFLMENISLTNRSFETSVPCLFADQTSVSLILESSMSKMRAVSKPIMVHSKRSIPMIIEPRPYQTFQLTENVTEIDVDWQLMQDNIPESIWESRAILSLFDIDKQKVTRTRLASGSGHTTLLVNSSYRCAKCLLIITPTGQQTACSTLIQPISIVGPNETVAQFDFDHGKNYCEWPDPNENYTVFFEPETQINGPLIVVILLIVVVIMMFHFLKNIPQSTISKRNSKTDEQSLLHGDNITETLYVNDDE